MVALFADPVQYVMHRPASASEGGNEGPEGGIMRVPGKGARPGVTAITRFSRGPRDPMKKPLRIALALFAAATLAACSAGEGADAPPATESTSVDVPAGPARAPDEVLATIDGEPVTMADVRQEVGVQLAEMDFDYRSQRHDLVESTLDRLVRERVLGKEADRRGMTTEELTRELTQGEVEVTDERVATFYNQNRARLQGASLEQIAPQIRRFLEEQDRERILQEFADELDRDVEIMLEPFRVELETEGHPASGPEDAPVTLVEFSDFQCPYCQSFLPTLEQIRESYGQQVRIVFRQFPLRSIHPQAQVAAEASLCAWEQDAFWELHDLMFQEQQSLTADELEEKAERLGLDGQAFGECLDSGRHADRVQDDLEAGVAAGVSGTPAVFVNGRPLPGGAVPFDMVSEVIEEELDRADR